MTSAQRRAERDRIQILSEPRGRWGRWVDLLDERESPTSLALIRIAIALVLLADWLIAWNLDLVPTVWGPSFEGGLGAADTWAEPPPFQQILGASVHSTWIVFGVALGSSVTMAVGLFSRTSALLLAASSAQLASTMGQSDRGIDIAIRIVLIILVFSGCGERWSLDALRKAREGAPLPKGIVATVPAWPRYLIIAQLVWIYFGAGIHKTQAAWWPQGDFSALYIVLRDPHFARFDMSWDSAYLLTQIGTFGTMLFEIGAPLMALALWYRRTADRPGRVRKWFNKLRIKESWIVIGVTFHIALMFTVRLGIFPYGMLAMYPAFFAPDELERWGSKLRTRLMRRAARP